MSLYTGRGDDGDTDLQTGERVSKADPRIEAYGTVDELNATLGTIRPTGYDDVDETLADVQNHLHVLQAELANPEAAADDPTIQAEHVTALETEIDAADDELPPLESFVLPGGSSAGSALHHARTICRRAERRTVALTGDPQPVRSEAVTYLNRLSDLLFTLGRLVNHRDGVAESAPTY
ncbi:cob(I)yrinic acid a,c-diamide adenosyltransferase [Halorhabdus sp. CBA1104]|uniref:cob(I)yrinic acid a,c-diamide adenosyltransferase n=1 Tax=unclassified Halorhabdus TaxID=2621901 RepID=UPI0012B1C2A4|nr:MULTISPECIES: cob(I)yrinic acid a,c-diamide adenosyltransferase [unclassified Halorhabdus]QGN08194.1 cob(I)yrinic acid a,c-diamide adenosyltransferase [Halorhabdus sp. CBA1104]